MKIETWLRAAKAPYETVTRITPFGTPMGKLPCIVDDDGSMVADSEAIISHLIPSYGDPFPDESMSREQGAMALAAQRLVEEHLYWCVVHDRWFNVENWKVAKLAYFGALPPAVRTPVAAVARAGMRRQMGGHGIGRHDESVISARGCADVNALADLLADKPYFMGQVPVKFDLVAFAVLSQILWAPLKSDLINHARSYTTLSSFCLRMWNAYYSDRPLPEAA